MDDVKLFLAWFAGWQENIEVQPNAVQWKRLCDRIEDLEKKTSAWSASAPAAVASTGSIVVHAPAPSAPGTLQLSRTKTEWGARYQATLIEGGFDDESAREMLGTTAVDLDVMPEVRARDDAGPILQE